MSIRVPILMLAPIATVGLSLAMALPAGADDCNGPNCTAATQAKPGQAKPGQAKPGQPIQLRKFRRTPVALGKPARAVKKTDGDYKKVKFTRRTQPKKPAAEPEFDPPQFLPVVVAPNAADALAMRNSLSNAAALVRVVDAEHVNEIDLAAPPPDANTPLAPVQVSTSSEPPVRVVSAAEINEIDRQIAAVTRDVAARQAMAFAKPPVRAAAAPEVSTLALWFENAVSWANGLFASFYASVRGLFG